MTRFGNAEVLQMAKESYTGAIWVPQLEALVSSRVGACRMTGSIVSLFAPHSSLLSRKGGSVQICTGTDSEGLANYSSSRQEDVQKQGEGSLLKAWFGCTATCACTLCAFIT